MPATCRQVPPLGDDLVGISATYRITYEETLRHLLFRKDCPLVPLTVSPGVRRNFVWLAGHGMLHDQPENYGPRRLYRGAIVGQCLGREEERRRYLFCGDTGRTLRRLLAESGLKSADDVYLTSLLKTVLLDKGKIKAGWIKQQAAVLTIEILLTRPRYVLALGTEAAKFFFGKQKFTLQGSEGRWWPICWDLRQSTDEEKTSENQYEFLMMPCMNPAVLEFEQTPENTERIKRVVGSFVSTLDNNSPTVVAPIGELSATGGLSGEVETAPSEQLYTMSNTTVTSYPVIRNIEQLGWMLEQCRDRSVLNLVGVDAEWQGAHPHNAGSYLRCVQFGWRAGEAAVMSLTDTQGNWTFADHNGDTSESVRKKAFAMVVDWFAKYCLRVAGFYFGADLEWLKFVGMNLSYAYEPADSPQEARTKGGFGVELAVAAVDELMSNNLETVRWRFTTVGDYFAPFDRFRNDAKFPDESIRKAGFGWIADEYLYPYAGGDADVTVQAAHRLMQELDSDRFGNNSWLPYWNALRASLTVCEIMQTGMPFSKRRCGEQALRYGTAFNRIIKRVRKALNWPKFNVDSPNQMAVALYGPRYSGKRDKVTGCSVDIRPPGALTLNLEPLINNDKTRPMAWSEVRAMGLEKENKPGTDAKALAMLRKSSDGVLARRKLPSGRFGVVQIDPPPLLEDLFLAKSVRTAQSGITGKLVCDPVIRFQDKGTGLGYAVFCCDDGYIRCFISQGKETGRWASSMPNLQVWPKRKENNYKLALKELYLAKLRTMIEAPDGYVIVEADYSSAELFMLAIASGDLTLWDHCRRNLLNPDDPQFIDPHSRLLVERFHLPCEPTQAGLDSIGKLYLREVAKCVATGEYLNTDRGLVRVEALAGGLMPEQVTDDLPVDNVQSDVGVTPLRGAMNVGKLECVRVVTHLGYEVTTSCEHQHYVLTSEGFIDFRPASELRFGDYMLMSLDSYFNARSGELPERLVAALDFLPTDRVYGESGITPQVAGLLAVLANAEIRIEPTGDRMVIILGNVTTKSRDDVLELIRWVMDDRDIAVGDAISRRHLYASSKGLAAVYRAVKACGWGSVPELLLMWPEALREAYCRGVVVARLGGIRQGQHVMLPVEDARRYQMTLQTMGWLTIRERRGDGSLMSVGVHDAGSLEFFDFARRNGVVADGVCEWRSDTDQVTFPATLRWLLEVARRSGIELRVSDGELPWSIAKPYLKSLLEQLLRQRVKLSTRDFELVSRLVDCLAANLVPVAVDRVERAGLRTVYDFETTSERRHLLFVNGMASHNSVIYGWCYGRMAAAIQRGAREEGIEVSLDETQGLIDGLSSTYSDAANYLEDAAARVANGFLITPMGRVRRRPDSTHRRKLGDFGREFKNAPIQGGVADVVNIAGYNLRTERDRRMMRFRIMMQIHDAYMFLCPLAEVYELCNEVIPKAMCDDIPIVPFRLDGSRSVMEPKRMGCGVALYSRWGDKLSKSALLDLGIDPSRIQRLE